MAVTPKQTDAHHRQVFSHMVLCNRRAKVLKRASSVIVIYNRYLLRLTQNTLF